MDGLTAEDEQDMGTKFGGVPSLGFAAAIRKRSRTPEGTVVLQDLTWFYDALW